MPNKDGPQFAEMGSRKSVRNVDLPIHTMLLDAESAEIAGWDVGSAGEVDCWAFYHAFRTHNIGTVMVPSWLSKTSRVSLEAWSGPSPTAATA